MIGVRVSLGLLIAIIVAGCGSTTTTSSASAVAVVLPSPSAASPSPSPVATPTATPDPTSIPFAAPRPTPAPWQSFTSKLNHYTISFPHGWIARSGSPTISDQYDGNGYPFVYISHDVAPVGSYASLSGTVKTDLAFYKSEYKAKVLANKSVTVAGWSGRVLTFDGVDGILRKQFQHLILVKGRVGYILDMKGYFEKGTEDKAPFKKIYSSFKPN